MSRCPKAVAPLLGKIGGRSILGAELSAFRRGTSPAASAVPLAPFRSGILPRVCAFALLSIAATAQGPLRITTRSFPDGTVGVPYAATVGANGGSAPYMWSIPAGTLPPGLTIGGGLISGTPTAAGSFPFTVQVTDAGGAMATADLSIMIDAPPLAVATSSLPSGTVGAAYSQTLSATGGIGRIRGRGSRVRCRRDSRSVREGRSAVPPRRQAHSRLQHKSGTLPGQRQLPRSRSPSPRRRWSSPRVRSRTQRWE